MVYLDKEKRRQANRNYVARNRVARNAAWAKRKEKLREWFRELKRGLKCARCSENHPACLDFHHRDRNSKLYTVSYMAGMGKSKPRILEEIAKCDILCANCHKKLHYDE